MKAAGAYRGPWILFILALAAIVTVSCTPDNQQRASVAAADGTPTSVADYRPATYIGEQACLECHEHAGEHYSYTLHSRTFKLNPRNQVEAAVCEACHGPGSLHAEETWDRDLIIGYTRHWDTPVAKQNAQCLSCHQGGERLHWVSSTHDNNQIACSDCHNPMSKFALAGGDLKKRGISETCYTCHTQQRAEFMRRSHMPLPEGKMSCVDCHNPHGSTTQPLLKADSVNEVCYACHAEKRGPFLWEHAPVRESCTNCHQPHGSNHDKLLVTARPFLCQQCHNSGGHPANLYRANQTAAAGLLPGGQPARQVIGRSCQNCHTQVHGSNHPAGARWQR
ncbi:DmsE family decaheme c-type cytochrome [Thioalkalicoccus limnaeus]|uniref:DmsE family decaheme c-type cytochrome n=1 Tax=Thioalkalicoccus limnaeus TaxID=120681 RepID=A0ABV4BBC2_9GAMM